MAISTIIVTETATADVITVQVPGLQGPSAMSVGTTNTLTPGIPGMWLQTGLGPNGDDFTMWIEDGS